MGDLEIMADTVLAKCDKKCDSETNSLSGNGNETQVKQDHQQREQQKQQQQQQQQQQQVRCSSFSRTCVTALASLRWLRPRTRLLDPPIT